MKKHSNCLNELKIRNLKNIENIASNGAGNDHTAQLRSTGRKMWGMWEIYPNCGKLWGV